MFNVSQYLAKFDSLLRSSSAIKKDIAEEIKNTTYIQIAIKDIDIRGTILFLNVSPLLKNELHLKKPLILKALKEKVRGQNITEIR